jgi:hypothetical protein
MQAVRSGKSRRVKGEILKTGLPFSRLLDKVGTLLVFTFFTDVEAFHGSVIAHYPGIYKAFCAFFLMIFE